jgi:hypothetical protein
MTAETRFEPSTVNVRIKISALWTLTLFVFAYVDLFSLYRPDVRTDLEAGEIGGFTYILGSAIEVALLATVVYYAWTWPKETPPTSATGREPIPHDIQPTAR